MKHYLKNVLKSVLVFPQLKKKVRERENFLENLNPDQFFTFLLNWWFKLRKFIVTPRGGVYSFQCLQTVKVQNTVGGKKS